MAIVTHEMDLARDVSDRVLYMDEGIIYEIGPPDQIFGNPQKEKTRAFINRIRSLNFRIASPDYDLYAMNAEIEAFCDKQYLSKTVRSHLLLLVEELLQLYTPMLAAMPLDLKIAYSEKSGTIEIVCENTGDSGNPIENDDLPDDLGLAIIRNMTDNIAFHQTDGKNTLTLMMKMN